MNLVADEFEEGENKIIARIVKWERHQASLEDIFDMNWKLELKGSVIDLSETVRNIVENAKRTGQIKLADSLPDHKDQLERPKYELAALIRTFRYLSAKDFQSWKKFKFFKVIFLENLSKFHKEL